MMVRAAFSASYDHVPPATQVGANAMKRIAVPKFGSVITNAILELPHSSRLPTKGL